MPDHHRFEELAVGHVLGGLDAVDQAEFRSHLLGCGACRTRVAELRDLASSLEAVEREERASTRVMMEVARREEEPDETARRRGDWSPRTTALVAGVAVALIGLLLWNFHLRDVNRVILETGQARESLLTLLAEGEPATIDAADGVAGVAAARDGRVAIDLARLPTADADQWIGVWLLTDEGDPTVYMAYPATTIEAGVFATAIDVDDAAAVLLTLERGSATGRASPAGRELARITLP